jgi:hypothetical protein
MNRLEQAKDTITKYLHNGGGEGFEDAFIELEYLLRIAEVAKEISHKIVKEANTSMSPNWVVISNMKNLAIDIRNALEGDENE